MNSMAPQEVIDFISRLNSPNLRTLVIFIDTAKQVGFSVVGRLAIETGGAERLVVFADQGSSIAASASFTSSLPSLLRFPCMFTDPRHFKATPFESFFEKDVQFHLGLTFALPNGALTLFELEESIK